MTLFGPVAVEFMIDREYFLSFIEDLNIVSKEILNRKKELDNEMSVLTKRTFDPIDISWSSEFVEGEISDKRDLIRDKIYRSFFNIDLYLVIAEDGLYGFTITKPGQDTLEYGDGKILRRSYIPVEYFSRYISMEKALLGRQPEPQDFVERVVKIPEWLLDPTVSVADYKRDSLFIFIQPEEGKITINYTPELPINEGWYQIWEVEILDLEDFFREHEIQRD